jgi:DNA-binding transcriptional LysR family regulator
MEWQQLEYFQIVAETQHFTRAAEILSITQPTLSRSIAKLESELGVPLFERKGRQVILNQFGRMFYKRTSRVLKEMSEAKQEILDLIDPDHGEISFAFLKSLGISNVPKIIHHFLKQYPSVNFNFYQNSRDKMFEQLVSGEIDLCLSSINDAYPGIEWVKLWSEEMFVFVSNEHHLAHQKIVSIHELAHEKFIVLKQGNSSRTTFDSIFKQAGLIPNITFEGDEIFSVLGFVSENLGITLHPKISGVNMVNLNCLRINESILHREIGIAWNKLKYLSPVANRFKQFLIEYYKNDEM